MIYKMDLKDSSDTMTFDLLETPIVDKDIEGAVDNVTLDGNQYTDYLYLKKQYIQKWAIMCPDEYDELRGFYTRQFEEGEVPSYRVYYGANVTRDYTFNGDYFQFNAEGIETGMTLTQLTGNAEQTTYSGKNLLKIDFTSTTTMGITITNNGDGTVTVSGTTTGAIGVNLSPSATNQQNPLTLAPNTAYTQRLEILSGSASNFSIVPAFKDSGGTVRYNFFQNNQTTTTTDTMTCSYYNIYWGAAGRVINATFRVWLEKGSDLASPYEPYVGGTPAPNPSYPQPISTVTDENVVKIVDGDQKNMADPQTFIDWVNRTYALCVQYSWSSVANRPAYGEFHGRSHVARFNADTLYTVRSRMTNPTYDEAREIYVNNGQFEQNTRYTISMDLFSTSVNTNIQILYTDGTYSPTASVSANAWAHSVTTTSADKTIKAIRMNYQSGMTYVDLDTLQIEEGTQASSYEPFISQSYEVNLGKNLFDASNTNTLALGTNTLVTNAAYRGYTLKAISGATYTLSRASTSTPPRFRVCFTKELPAVGVSYYDQYGSLGVSINADSLTATTFTVPSDMGYIFIYLSNNGTLIDESMKIQLERGSQATAYAPYFTPIELCKVGNYQDRIYKDDGKWYIEKQIGKVVLDGTTTLTQLQASTNTTRVVATISSEYGAPLSTVQLPLCDYFTGNSSVWSTDIQGTYIQSRYVVLRANNATVGATLDSFKTWLASNPTTVYYALATPTTTEITDETSLAQLNFLASLYEGKNNISLVGTGAQGEMEVFIRDVMSVETDVVPEVPVRLTLTDDGVINACGCRRNVQLTMRETTE